MSIVFKLISLKIIGIGAMWVIRRMPFSSCFLSLSHKIFVLISLRHERQLISPLQHLFVCFLTSSTPRDSRPCAKTLVRGGELVGSRRKSRWEERDADELDLLHYGDDTPSPLLLLHSSNHPIDERSLCYRCTINFKKSIALVREFNLIIIV